MNTVASFPGRTRDSHREIYYCENCLSRTFKFVMVGGSREILVECSNCENVQQYFKIGLDE